MSNKVKAETCMQNHTISLKFNYATSKSRLVDGKSRLFKFTFIYAHVTF